MRVPTLIAALLAAGAWAACPAADAQQGSKDQGLSGTTGGGTDMPASPHQQQVLEPGKDQPAAGGQQGSPAQGVSGAVGAGVAAEGGVQGDCPPGQVTSPGGGCALAQPNPTGTITGAEGGADMPASPHQQQLLKTMKDKGSGSTQ
jgi:hypothetical protein